MTVARSKNEEIKQASRFLRGGIARTAWPRARPARLPRTTPS